MKDKTKLVHMARNHAEAETQAVNPPVIRASTVLYRDTDTLKSIRTRREGNERVFSYGARGTPTTFALEDAITEIEQGVRTMLFPSGLAAIAHVFLSVLKPGDHCLLSESIYGPARAIAVRFLRPRGIDCEFYPGGHEEVAKRLRPETRLVYVEIPGSIIYDLQDLPAIAALLKDRENTLLAADNTWGAPGLYCPIALGADISIVAVTKYIAGHSDLVMGSVTANARAAEQLAYDAGLLGQTVSPDDAYAALRGLRTASARIAMHCEHAKEVIRWLEEQPQVERVLYPPLPSHPGHEIWKRDFTGANGLLSVAFKPHIKQDDVDHMADRLKLFGLGASWGGYESLAMVYPEGGIPGWKGGALIRLHIGLEDPADLIADLQQAFAGLPTK
ncbi:MAG: cystathionine beta-lyase [Proteobacteria bacterium]|jgi:cystathionine beta-lyase, bacterial|nr:MAG: cystathionine beta-lyase [Pseudomonadota bacterium]